MIDPQVVAFTTIAAVLAVTPGADTMLVIKNSVRHGARGGQATTLGVLGGTLFHAVVSALGLSVILAQSALLFRLVQTLGAAYLIWLGVQSLRSAHPHGDCSAARLDRTLSQFFREGLVSNMLNPKVAIFYMAFLPQFISPGDPVLVKSVLLATIHNLLSLLWLGGLSVAIGRGQGWIQRRQVQAWLTRVSGILLIGFGLRLALDHRST
jgi:RhtB (resistance to homoserine/threonine) family protein